MTKERVYWVPVSSQLPDDEIVVNVFHPSLNEPVWLGYYNQGVWYTSDGMPLPTNSVTYWAEILEGPKL